MFGYWDVSSVTIMEHMFFTCTCSLRVFPRPGRTVGGVPGLGGVLFYLPIGNWDVSSVTNMATCFLTDEDVVNLVYL